jgi:hypothetical protein
MQCTATIHHSEANVPQSLTRALKERALVLASPRQQGISLPAEVKGGIAGDHVAEPSECYLESVDV